MEQEHIDTKVLFAPKKGKEATKGQKQIYEANKETIRFYVILAMVPLCLKILVTSLFSTTLDLLLTLFAIIVQTSAVGVMNYMARPVTSGASKTVVDGGLDLNMKGGFADHLKDLVITTSICTGLSIFSNGFWVLWLWLPAYLVYKFWVGIIAPWVFAPAPEEPSSEAVEKKRRKKERKMARAGYMR